MIRRYLVEDKIKVIELLKLNTPRYFAPSEQADFEDYLENEIEDYFVYLEDTKIIGVGGINYFPEKNLARISWDMIDPAFHGRGIGKKITQYRLNEIAKNPNIESIEVRTTQLAYQFYQKMGFELDIIEKDFWAENFDLYHMIRTNK